MEPRHGLIVSEILGSEHARLLTFVIGLAEIFMAIWILSKYRSRLNAIIQIIVIMTMNALEFFLVPELLLWGRVNILFACALVLVIFFNEFVLAKRFQNSADS